MSFKGTKVAAYTIGQRPLVKEQFYLIRAEPILIR